MVCSISVSIETRQSQTRDYLKAKKIIIFKFSYREDSLDILTAWKTSLKRQKIFVNENCLYPYLPVQKPTLRFLIKENACQKKPHFVEIAVQHGCSVNLLHVFRTPFPRNTSGWLLLNLVRQVDISHV